MNIIFCILRYYIVCFALILVYIFWLCQQFLRYEINIRNYIISKVISFTDDAIKDLLRLSRMYEEPMGITQIGGRCLENVTILEDLPSPDSIAFRLDERAQLSISTAHTFPRGFPQDFSILMVARPTPGNTNK